MGTAIVSLHLQHPVIWHSPDPKQHLVCAFVAVSLKGSQVYSDPGLQKCLSWSLGPVFGGPWSIRQGRPHGRAKLLSSWLPGSRQWEEDPRAHPRWPHFLAVTPLQLLLMQLLPMPNFWCMAFGDVPAAHSNTFRSLCSVPFISWNST